MKYVFAHLCTSIERIVDVVQSSSVVERSSERKRERERESPHVHRIWMLALVATASQVGCKVDMLKCKYKSTLMSLKSEKYEQKPCFG